MEEGFRCQFCEKQFDERFYLLEHSEICQLKPVECDSHKINNHMEGKVICDHCEQDFFTIEIDDHYNVCQKKLVSCPHDCDASLILKEDLDKHLKTICTALTKPCDFEYCNCNFRGTKPAIDLHLEEKSHYHLQLLAAKMVERLTIVENKLSETVEKLTYTENKLFRLQEEVKLSNSYIWKISDWKKKMEDAKSGGNSRCLHSPEFYTYPHGYRMRVRLWPNGYGVEGKNHMSVYLWIQRGEYDSYTHLAI